MSRMARRAIPCLLLLSLALPPSGRADEPTSESLWRERPPPFRVYAEGFAGAPRPGAAIETRLGVVPWFLPPLDPSAERKAALEQAASHAAARFASAGLRAPRITRRDGVFPLYFVRDLGAAAAQYGPGYGEIGMTEALRVAEDDWDRVIAIGEADGFGPDLGIYPEKVAASGAHELFHGVQASYAHWSGHDATQSHEQKWVTEALADAIALWGIEGLTFLGNPPFDPRRRFASGSQRFGKALGLRPYDYPLDMRTAPPSMPIYPGGKTAESRQQMASYMTNSFWSFVWQHSLPAGKEWTPMSRALLLRTPARGTASLREDSVAWAHRSLVEYHPAWVGGLYDALPAFIAWWVAYPDQVMRSRRGEFAHQRWLGHAFVDGCPSYEINEAQPVVSFKLAVRELAAACVRVKWTGAPVGQSGWPAAALVAVAADGGGEAALDDLHVGIHGSDLGKPGGFTDASTGLPAIAWSGLSLDPLNPSRTEGETVITFTNVARDPLATRGRSYDIQLGVGTASASGQVTKPADAAQAQPASRVRVPDKRRAVPAVVAPGKGRPLQATPAPAAGKDDCDNATMKTASATLMGFASRVRERPAPSMQAICLGAVASLDRDSLQPPLVADVQLKLPMVPVGHAGPLPGAEVHVDWRDPALGGRGKDGVSARTRDVRLEVEESTLGFVRGRYAARFVAAKHGVEGELAGDFLVWRAHADELRPPGDPLDIASSDLLLTFAATGKDVTQMRAQLGRRGGERADREPTGDAGGACSLDCDALRHGQVSASCRSALAELYEACGDHAATDAAEVRALATWMLRNMPEPMRTEMVGQLVDQIMAMPSAMREDWARKLRAERDGSGSGSPKNPH